jgi:ADP-ribose pyrophosphatase YjhB (NUDIX family)
MTGAHVFIRFLQPKYTVGVVGVIFNEKGQILLVEHVFHPARPWGLPGGWIGGNEEPALAVSREFREELDLDIEVEMLLLAERSERNHLDLAYLCQQRGAIGQLNSELLDYRWFDPLDLPPLTGFHYKAIQRALQVVRVDSRIE